MIARLPLLNVLIIFVCLCSFNIFAAEEGPNSKQFVEVRESLGFIRNVHLVVVDEVEGRCWTNVDQVKQRVRLVLEQSGVSVFDEALFILSPFSTNIVISALGLRSESGICFGNIEVMSFREILYDFGDISLNYFGENFSRNSIALSRTNLNSSFLSAADTFVSELSADIISGRRNPIVRKVLERQKSTSPMTMRQFDELIDEALNKK